MRKSVDAVGRGDNVEKNGKIYRPDLPDLRTIFWLLKGTSSSRMKRMKSKRE